MTYVLHIGTHKTGTTALQQFAAANRRTLRQRNLWYPSYKQTIGIGGRFAHHHFSYALAEQAENLLSMDDARRFVSAIREKKKPDETVLLSAEPIYRLTLPAPGGYWAERAAYVERLREFFPWPNVKILCVLRRQDSFARSLYQERIKVTRYPGRFRDFITEEPEPFDYHRQLELFRSAFGQVEVLTYENLVKRGLMDAFFEHLGVSVADIPNRSSLNTSLPMELVEFKRILNGTPLETKRLWEIGSLLMKKAAEIPKRATGPIDWMSSEETVAFLESFAELNERVRSDFASQLSAPLFPPYERPAAEPAIYRGMSAQRFAWLAAKLLLGGEAQEPAEPLAELDIAPDEVPDQDSRL